MERHEIQTRLNEIEAALMTIFHQTNGRTRAEIAKIWATFFAECNRQNFPIHQD